MYLEILLFLLLLFIIKNWNVKCGKEGMCNMEYQVCDYNCQKAKYEVCLVKGSC